MKALPPISSMRGNDILIPFESAYRDNKWHFQMSNASGARVSTYVQIHDPNQATALNEKLAAFTTERLTKQRSNWIVGIRKVLGASVSEITALLSREFVLLLTIANLIALPIAYWAMGKWLNGFAYRIEPGVKIHILCSLLAVVIALCTVSFQAIRAARSNPVDALRYE